MKQFCLMASMAAEILIYLGNWKKKLKTYGYLKICEIYIQKEDQHKQPSSHTSYFFLIISDSVLIHKLGEAK